MIDIPAFNPVARAFEIAAAEFLKQFGPESFWAAAAERGRKGGTPADLEAFQALFVRTSARWTEAATVSPSIAGMADGLEILAAQRIWLAAQNQAAAEGREVIERMRAMLRSAGGGSV